MRPKSRTVSTQLARSTPHPVQDGSRVFRDCPTLVPAPGLSNRIVTVQRNAAVKSVEKTPTAKTTCSEQTESSDGHRRGRFGTSPVSPSGPGCRSPHSIGGCLCVRKARERRKCLETQKPFTATRRVNETRPAKPRRQPEASTIALSWCRWLENGIWRKWLSRRRHRGSISRGSMLPTAPAAVSASSTGSEPLHLIGPQRNHEMTSRIPEEGACRSAEALWGRLQVRPGPELNCRP